MGVDEAKRLVEALGAHDREHRPEYLLAVDAHLGRHLVEQRAADEEALLIALDVEPASVDHQLSAFGHACVDKIGRAHVRTPGTNAQLVYRLHLDKNNKLYTF